MVRGELPLVHLRGRGRGGWLGGWTISRSGAFPKPVPVFVSVQRVGKMSERVRSYISPFRL